MLFEKEIHSPMWKIYMWVWEILVSLEIRSRIRESVHTKGFVLLMKYLLSIEDNP